MVYANHNRNKFLRHSGANPPPPPQTQTKKKKKKRKRTKKNPNREKQRKNPKRIFFHKKTAQLKQNKQKKNKKKPKNKNNTALNFKQQVTGSISPSVANATTLRILTLSYSRINGTLPDSIGAMTNLTQIAIENGNIVGTIPDRYAKTFLRPCKISYAVSSCAQLGQLEELGSVPNCRNEAHWLDSRLAL